jgi:hypothetical protein
MRRNWCVFLALFPTIAQAEVTTLFCRPENGADWVGQIDIDLTERTIVWGTENYSITYLDDLYIVAVESGAGSIAATTFLIERDTGSFVRAGVGRFCADGDCKEVFTGHFSDEGTCRAQSF